MKTLSQKIMAIAFMLLSVTISAFADTWKDPSTGITWTYTVLDDGTVALGGGGTSIDDAVTAVPNTTTGELIVPSQINGMDVSSVMPYAFYNCQKITSFQFDTTISLQADASAIFRSCIGLTNIDFLANWNTSNVTNMSYMFGTTNWIISGTSPDEKMIIEDLTPLANWDVSNVTDMSYMFARNTKISDLTSLANWNVSKVRNMSGLFMRCFYITDLTPLRNWDVSKVRNMRRLFCLNSNITDLTPLANWDVSNVTNMSDLFASCSKITNLTPLASWDVSNVTDMSGLFSSCSKITDLAPLANWDVSKVKIMGNTWTSQTIDKTKFGGIFAKCTGLTDLAPLANWDTSNVTNMSYLFYGCTKVGDLAPLKNWNTGKVTNMSGIFMDDKGITALAPLANWNVSNMTNVSSAFYNCTGITDLAPLANWNTGKVSNMSSVFNNCTGITDLAPLANWNTSNATNMSKVFYKCTGITDLTPLANWNTGKVTNMSGLFYSCTGITDLAPLANWNVSKVKTLGGEEYISRNPLSIFYNCTGITDVTPLANWDVSNVTDMSYMFASCTGITELTPLANWNTSNVEKMFGLFYKCKNETHTDFLINWDVSKVTDMGFLFGNAQLESVNISTWDVTGKEVKSMFSYRGNGHGWGTFDESKIKRLFLPKKGLVEIQYGMFNGCTTLEEITIPSTVTKIERLSFNNCSSLKEITIPSKVNDIEKEAFKGCDNLSEVYCMATTPPDLDPEAFGNKNAKINKTLYVKSSALEAYKAHEQWSRFATITDIIPIVIGTGKNYATLSLDFDADFSETEGAQPYIASKYLEGEEAVEYLSGFEAKMRLGSGLQKAASTVNPDIRLIVLAHYPDGYVPSRTGEDNFDFHGVILYGQPGTYYFKMGEQDFASDSQRTVTWNTNYMKSAYESWLLNPTYDHEPANWMEYPKENTYNFVLKSNKFKYIDNAGTISRHRSWLELPAEKVSGAYFEAGAKMVSLFDPDDYDSFANGLSFVVEDEPVEIQSRYNLNGQKVDASYKGLVITRGRKILNR